MLIPEGNVKDLSEIPENVQKGLATHPVKWFDQVLGFALERQPEPVVDAPVVADEANSSVAVETAQHTTKH